MDERVQYIKEKEGIAIDIVNHTIFWYGPRMAVNLGNGPGFFVMNPSLVKKYG